MEPDKAALDDYARDGTHRLISELARKMRHAEGISDEQYEERMKALVAQGEREIRERWIARWGQPPEAGPIPEEKRVPLSERKKQWEKSQADSQKQNL